MNEEVSQKLCCDLCKGLELLIFFIFFVCTVVFALILVLAYPQDAPNERQT